MCVIMFRLIVFQREFSYRKKSLIFLETFIFNWSWCGFNTDFK